jgi:hypothetical protein
MLLYTGSSVDANRQTGLQSRHVVIYGRSGDNRLLRVMTASTSGFGILRTSAMFYAGPEDAGGGAEACGMWDLILWFLDTVVWGA